MKQLENIELLNKFLSEYEYDQIYCSEEFLTEIANRYNFKMNGEMLIDGFNDSKVGTILVANKEIEVHLILDLDTIILKHSTIKNERKIKLKKFFY